MPAVGFSHGRGSLGHYVLNLGAVPGLAYPFVNFFKSCDVYQSTNYAFPSILNNDGYPQSTPAVDTVLGCYIPPSYTGSYYIAWTGQFGTGGVAGVSVLPSQTTTASNDVTVQAGNSFVTSTTGGLFLTGTNGAVTFTPPALTARVQLHFLTTGTISAVTNIALCRTDQVASAAACLALTGTAALNPDYLAIVRYLNPRVLRFLGYSNTNSSNRSKQAYDTPVTAITYAAPYFATDASAGAWGGTIASGSYNSGTDTYTGSAPPGWPGFVQGAVAQFFVVSTNNSATPKLIINGVTTQIGNMGANSPSSSPTVGAGFIPANSLVTFVYDKNTNLFLATTTVGNAPGGMTASVPQLVDINFCNALGKDCWIQIPQLFDDASGVAFASAMASNLNPSNKAFIEYSNEIGTTSPAFQQFYWATANATALGLPIGYHDWYALRARQLFGAITSAWPNLTSQLVRVASAEIFFPIAHVVSFRFGSNDLSLDASGNYTSGTGSLAATGQIKNDAGTGAGTHMTISAASGKIYVGMGVTGAGVTGGTVITDYDGAVNGGLGRYTVNTSQNISSEALTLTPAGSGLSVATDYTTAPNRMIDFGDIITVADYFWGGESGGPSSTGNFIVKQNGLTISALTNANPPVASVTANGYSNGDRIQLTGVTQTGTAAISSISWSGGIATVTTVSPHGVTNGNTVQLTIAGSTASVIFSGYNGTFPATITGASTFTYPLAVNPGSETTPGTFIGTLRNVWATVASVATDSFALSSLVDNNGNALSADSTGYGTYTASSGLSNRVVPGLNTDLLAAADNYAGTPAQQTTALNWFDNDIRAGSQLDATGTPVLGQGTLLYLQTQAFPLWTNGVWGPGVFNKPAWLYEGGYQYQVMSALQAAQLGIAPSYPIKIANLFNGYMTNSRFANVTSDLSYMFLTFANAKAPGWLVDVGAIINGGTASISGTTLTTTAGTWVVGGTIYAVGVPLGVTIVKQITGTFQGNGTYQLSSSLTVASEKMFEYSPAGLTSQWSTYSGDTYSPPFQSAAGLANFNSAPRRRRRYVDRAISRGRIRRPATRSKVTARRQEYFVGESKRGLVSRAS